MKTKSQHFGILFLCLIFIFSITVLAERNNKQVNADDDSEQMKIYFMAYGEALVENSSEDKINIKFVYYDEDGAELRSDQSYIDAHTDLRYKAPAETTRIDFYFNDDFKHRFIHDPSESGVRVTVNSNNEIIYSTYSKYENKI